MALFASSGIRAQAPASEFDQLAAQAAAARDQQNFPQAIELYGKALQLKPEWEEGWWSLGVMEYSADQFAQAIDALNHLLQLEPKAVPAMVVRGLSEFETADYSDSLNDLEESVKLGAANDKDHEQVIRYHLGLLLVRAGRYWDALNQYKPLALEHFDDPDFPVAIGLAGMRARSLPGDVSAQDRELYTALGKAGEALMAGDSESADAQFQVLFARNPTTPNLHYFYAMLLFPHDWGMAAEQFEKENAISPSDELVSSLLSFTLMYIGSYREAVPVAEHALAAQPGMLVAQLALARSLIETGDEKRGVAMLNQVLASDPNNIEAHLGLVAAYSRDGRKEDAYRERMVCLGLADK